GQLVAGAAGAGVVRPRGDRADPAAAGPAGTDPGPGRVGTARPGAATSRRAAVPAGPPAPGDQRQGRPPRRRPQAGPPGGRRRRPLEIAAATFERALIVAAATGREAGAKVDRARDLLAELKAREAALRILVQRCVRTVSPAPHYAVPDVSAIGPVPNTPDRLD